MGTNDKEETQAPELVSAAVSEAARTLGMRGASKGGKARAEKLTPEERSEIARKAIEARWAKQRGQATEGGDVILTAICGSSPDRPLRIGDTEIQAYVLDDGTRVLTQADFLESLGRHRKANVRNEGGEERLPAILQGKSIKPFLTEDLIAKSRPIRFRTPGGSIASGYRAELLPDICEVYLKARESGTLNFQQTHVAQQAEILMRSLAKVGIIALVDEATGYQDVRAKDALAKILEKFVAKEIQPVVKLFPLEYFKGLCKLWNVPFSPNMKLPRYFGKLTNNIIYARLAPAVLEEIQLRNPVVNGRRKNKHYQWLTQDVGHPKVLQLLGSVCTIMDFADGSKERFWELLDRRHPKYKDLPLFRNMQLD